MSGIISDETLAEKMYRQQAPAGEVKSSSL